MNVRRIAIFAWAVLFEATLSSGAESCTSVPENELAARGEALLQKVQSREPSLVEVSPHAALGDDNEQRAAVDELLRQAGYSSDGYQGAPGCVAIDVEARRRQAALFTISKRQESVGVSAPLDASGFLETTTLCCPHEMEQFFGRLLHARGLEVCSKPHVQGLMHWFSCVPDMDFQYVLEVIENGNPCKYWAPKGQECPELSAACRGHHCDGNTTDIDVSVTAAPTTTAPSTTAPTTTTASTTAPTTTTPSTTAPTTTAASTTLTTTKLDCQRPYVELKFWQSTLVSSNLNNVGPDTSAPEGIRALKVGKHDGKDFDLVINSITDRYRVPADHAQYNNMYGYFFYLGMNSDSGMDLRFTIVESGTDTPMTLPRFFFTFFDLDTGNPQGDQSGGAESGFGKDFVRYFVSDATELNVSSVVSATGGMTQFKATTYGDHSDNPTDPFNLTPLQENRVVTLEFENTATWEVSYENAAGSKTNGRDLYFAGKSELAMCKADPTQRRGIIKPVLPPGFEDPTAGRPPPNKVPKPPAYYD